MLTTELLDQLRPMIGFRQNPLTPDQDTPELSADLKNTSTGITADQCHELLQTQTLFSTYTGKPEEFTNYLTQSRDDAIRALLSTIDGRLAEAGLSAQLLAPKLLFASLATLPPLIAKSGRLVGLLIKPAQTDVTLTIERLLFTGSTPAGFTLTLTTIETGETKPIPVTAANAWQPIALKLRAGYTYTLLYNEADLGDPYVARNTVSDWPRAKSGCASCLAGCLSNYVRIDAVSFVNGVSTATRSTNYGLNLVISAEADVTGRLVDNPRRLIPALKQQIALSFLEKIAYSTRKNAETEDARQGALFALTDKENANRVPILYERVIASLIKSMQAEASAAIDVNQSDEIGWSSM